jgi:vacuolar-type H+-ATPase subunit D/Vma8
MQNSTYFPPACNARLLIHRALTGMKNRLKGAQTGHSLLKRKAEALTRRFRDIVKKIDEVENLEILN